MKYERPRQLTLIHMVLWVAVCSVLCLNLKIVAIDQRENVVIIWKELLRWNPADVLPSR